MKTFIGLRCNRDYVKKNGRSQLYLLIGIEKAFDKIKLNLDWPAALVDEKTNHLIGRQKVDQDADDYNLLIRQAITKANDIFVECRLQRRDIGMTEFMDLYHNHLRQHDFVVYMEEKINERHRRKKISWSTRNSHVNTLIWLKQYKSSIPFKDLTKKFIESFEEWMLRQTSRRSNEKKRLDTNTIANVLKYIRAYINLAIRDKIPIENPYKGADVKTHQDIKLIEHLKAKDVAELISYYGKDDIPIGEKLTVCRLLIACHLSLRISDIMKINRRKFYEYQEAGKLIFHPQKQVRTKKLKTVFVHIDEIAMQYLEDCVELQDKAAADGLKITEPYGRKVLKKVGGKLGINVSGFHMGRHTFATNYLRAGGKVTNLQHIMGHSDIRTTMRYVHIIEEDTEADMLSLSKFYLVHMK